MKKFLSVILAMVMVLSTFSLVTTASAMETVDGSFDYLVNYIQENGTLSDEYISVYDFNYYVDDDDSFDVCVSYLESSNIVTFQLLYADGKYSEIVTMGFGKSDYNYLSLFTFKYLGTDSAYATLYPQSYNKGSLTYSFKSTYSNTAKYKATVEDFFDATAALALDIWNGWLKDNLGISMGNFGFTKLYTPISLPQKAPTISFTSDDISLNYKSSTSLNVDISNVYGTSYKVEYTSSNPSVATVDNNGNVYGASEGNTTITVNLIDSYGNVLASDTCNVSVTYSFVQWLIRILLFGWLWY